MMYGKIVLDYVSENNAGILSPPDFLFSLPTFGKRKFIKRKKKLKQRVRTFT